MTDGYKIKRILVWQNNQEKQIYPAAYKREPTANTMLYLPLESDVKDYSLNIRGTFTNVGTLGTKGGLSCWYCGTTGGIFLGTGADSYLRSTNYYTCSVLVYSNGTNSYNSRLFEFNVNGGIGCGSTYGLSNSSNGNYRTFGGTTRTFSSILSATTWVNIVLVNNNGSLSIYKNGQLFDSRTDNNNHGFGTGVSYQNGCNIAGNRTSADGGYDNESLNGGMREFIWENKVWSAEDVSNYYNRIKAKLGF